MSSTGWISKWNTDVSDVADSFGARREHRRPCGREDRSAGRVVLHEAEQQHRVFLEVVGQMLRAAPDAHELLALGIVGRGRGGRDAILVDRLPQQGHAPAVDGPELVAHLRVVDNEETPVLRVASARRAHGRVEDALLDVGGDRVGL